MFKMDNLFRHDLAASILISWNANLDITDINGCTPLHLDTTNGFYKITRMLLLNGADKSIQTIKG